MNRTLIPLGIMIRGPGDHACAWKYPGVPTDANVNLQFFIGIAKKAENSGIAFGLVGDGTYVNENYVPHLVNRFEPISLLSALASVTTKLGLTATISASQSDPYASARQLASLDLISGGRAGCHVVTEIVEGPAAGHAKPPIDREYLYDRADEYLGVAQSLWDSWDDDAFPRDRTSGKFFDRTKLHRLKHNGRHFQVEGALSVGRSPQGQPVVFHSAWTQAGATLAGKYADVALTNWRSPDATRTLARQVRAAALLHGREAAQVKIFPIVCPIVAATDAEADVTYRKIRAMISIDEALVSLGRFFDCHDFNQYPLDGPFPDVPCGIEGHSRAIAERIKDEARRNCSTLREVALDLSTPDTTLVGSGKRVAAELIRWFDQGGVDGFVLAFPLQAQGLDDFVTHVVPVLEARRRYQRTLTGSTLRDHLQLSRKISRYEGASVDVKRAADKDIPQLTEAYPNAGTHPTCY
jgi:FMN-dependent oxidoreductase (nitrilotriacetate monooxygenase family)